MNKKHLNYKKTITLFHVIFAILTLLSILFYIKTKFSFWIFIPFLALYFISGVVILIIYYKFLGPIQKSYFELLFIAPFLIIAFFVATKLFERLMFG